MSSTTTAAAPTAPATRVGRSTRPVQRLAERMLRSPAVAALTSPHGVDRYLEIVNPMWAAHEVRARVVDVRRENPLSAGPEVATLTLQPTSTWRGHRAGQYVQVGVELPGSARRLTRCFSISSAESGPGEPFTLTIRAHEEGQVSKFLVRDARPGQVLHLGQAEGAFTLPVSPATPGPHPLLMISGGSGITPVMAQLRTLLRDGYDGRAGRPVTFVHFARSAEDQIFAEELAAIDLADNDVDVRLFHGDALFSAELIGRILPSYRDVDTWVCGPAGMVELVQQAYAGGEKPSKLRVEFFKTPLTTAGDASGTVSFNRAGRSAANAGSTLLEQAEAAGLSPEFGCRMGICMSCTSRKTAGTVRNVVTGVESALPDEDIQICVSAPVGDCAVDL